MRDSKLEKHLNNKKIADNLKKSMIELDSSKSVLHLSIDNDNINLIRIRSRQKNEINFAIFRINNENMLGKGGFGTVLQANTLVSIPTNTEKLIIEDKEPTYTNCNLVVKINPVTDNAISQSFKREAAFLTHSGDTNAEYIHDDGVDYIIQSKAAGKDIFKLNKNTRTNIFNNLPLYKRLILIRKFISKLKRLAQSDIAHLDIKPENIVVDLENLNIEIIDLGLAISSEEFCKDKDKPTALKVDPFIESSASNPKKPFIRRGSVAFMSPEMLNNNFHFVRKRADIYSSVPILMILLGVPEDYCTKEKVDMTMKVNELQSQINQLQYKIIGAMDSIKVSELETQKKSLIDQRNKILQKIAAANFPIDNIYRSTQGIPQKILSSLHGLLKKMSNTNHKERPKIRRKGNGNIKTLTDEFENIVNEYLEDKVNNYINTRGSHSFFSTAQLKDSANKFFNTGFSRQDKLTAARYLLIYVKEPSPENYNNLAEHKPALTNGDLGSIYLEAEKLIETPDTKKEHIPFLQ